MQLICCAFALAAASAGINKLAKIAMIAITTSSSISVNPSRLLCSFINVELAEHYILELTDASFVCIACHYAPHQDRQYLRRWLSIQRPRLRAFSLPDQVQS